MTHARFKKIPSWVKPSPGGIADRYSQRIEAALADRAAEQREAEKAFEEAVKQFRSDYRKALGKAQQKYARRCKVARMERENQLLILEKIGG